LHALLPPTCRHVQRLPAAQSPLGLRARSGGRVASALQLRRAPLDVRLQLRTALAADIHAKQPANAAVASHARIRDVSPVSRAPGSSTPRPCSAATCASRTSGARAPAP